MTSPMALAYASSRIGRLVCHPWYHSIVCTSQRETPMVVLLYCVQAHRGGLRESREPALGRSRRLLRCVALSRFTTLIPEPRHERPPSGLKFLDPGSGRKIPATWHDADANPGDLSKKPSTEDGQFRVVVLRLAWTSLRSALIPNIHSQLL